MSVDWSPISQIFQYLTRKTINNSVTAVSYKSIQKQFLESKNISRVATTMYNSMRIINKPCYFKFKDRVDALMNNWIWEQSVPVDDIDADYAEYTVCRLNTNFISAHRYLVDKPNVSYAAQPRVPALNQATHSQYNTGIEYEDVYNVDADNVYRDKFKIVARDEYGNLKRGYKAGANMMPQDYQNWDVWRPRNVYADFDFEKYRSFRDQYGYAGNYIPRNEDRDPASFGLATRDPFRASLSDVPRAYDQDEYMRAKGILPFTSNPQYKMNRDSLL